MEIEICPILHEEIKEGKTLPCNHKFEKHAIEEWLKNNFTCPICRASSIELKDYTEELEGLWPKIKDMIDCDRRVRMRSRSRGYFEDTVLNTMGKICGGDVNPEFYGGKMHVIEKKEIFGCYFVKFLKDGRKKNDFNFMSWLCDDRIFDLYVEKYLYWFNKIDSYTEDYDNRQRIKREQNKKRLLELCFNQPLD